MITWMQTALGKHYKWAFFLLLVIITFAFVLVLGIGSGAGRVSRTPERLMFGVNVNSERDMRRVGQLTSISVELQTGGRNIDQNTFQQYAFNRLALLSIANRFAIPAPSPESLREFIQSRPLFHDDKGRFNPAAYSAFLDRLRTDSRISEADVALVIEEDYRISRAEAILGGPGYASAWEAERMLAAIQTTFALETASITYADFRPEITVKEEDITAFYEQTSARYTRPEQRVVRQIVFSSAEFASRVEAPTEQQLRSFFDANRARFTPAPAEDKAAPEVSFESVQEAVREAFLANAATRLAGRAADDFTFALFESGARSDTEALERFLAQRGVTAEVLPPFTATQPPPGVQWSAEVTRQAFALNPTRFVSDPLPTGDNFSVLIYAGTIEARVPELSEIREIVERDFREQERRRLFTERGIELRANLEAKLAAGTSFADAARELGLQHARFEEVTRQQPPQGLDWAVLSQIDELPTNEISNMIATQDRGLFVRVTERREPPAANLAFMTGFMRMQLAQQGASQTRLLALAEIQRAEQLRTESRAEREARLGNDIVN